VIGRSIVVPIFFVWINASYIKNSVGLYKPQNYGKKVVLIGDVCKLLKEVVLIRVFFIRTLLYSTQYPSVTVEQMVSHNIGAIMNSFTRQKCGIKMR